MIILPSVPNNGLFVFPRVFHYVLPFTVARFVALDEGDYCRWFSVSLHCLTITLLSECILICVSFLSHLHLFASNLPLAYCLAPPPLRLVRAPVRLLQSIRFLHAHTDAFLTQSSLGQRADKKRKTDVFRHSRGTPCTVVHLFYFFFLSISFSFPSSTSTLPSVSFHFLRRPCLPQLQPSAVPAIHCSAFRLSHLHLHQEHILPFHQCSQLPSNWNSTITTMFFRCVSVWR